MSAPTIAPAVSRSPKPRGGARPVDATAVRAWLDGLDLRPLHEAERDGATSWDLLLDGRVRRSIRVTLILAPSVALVAWVHYAPALGDGLRRGYRQLLRWNDELPFVKFCLSEDDRPVLTAESPADQTDADRLGLMLARLVATCDLLHEDSRRWLEAGPPEQREPPDADEGGPGRGLLLDRYADRLRELIDSAPPVAEVDGP